MARVVTVKVFDGKENTLEETLVNYPIDDAPSDVMFFSINGTVYAQWWNLKHELVKVPAYQLVSIE